MYSCADGNLAFQHASDHAFDAESVGCVTDLHCFMDTACFHQLDVHQICPMLFHHTHTVLIGKYAFICKDRGLYMSRYILHPFKIMIGYRLLHQFDPQTCILHSCNGRNCFFPGPALVGIHADHHVFPHSLADLTDTLHILLTAFSYFDLQDTEAFPNCFYAVPYHFICIIYADGNICFQFCFYCRRVFFPKKPEKRLFLKLCIKIIKRNVHSCLCCSIFGKTLFHFCHNRWKVIQIHPCNRRGNIITDGCLYGLFRVSGDHGRRRCFPITFCPILRCYLYDQVIHTVYCTESCLKWCNKRDFNVPDCNFFQFHNLIYSLKRLPPLVFPKSCRIP